MTSSDARRRTVAACDVDGQAAISDAEDREFAVTPLEEAIQNGGPIDITVESRAHGWRLDHYLSRLFSNHSRAQLQRAIDSGTIQLNGLQARSSRRLRVNDRIRVELPDAEESRVQPEEIPLDILYEDAALVVVNKAADMVVHPGRGNYRGTLAGALQFHFNRLSDVGGLHRPGIVHRLDRDTSGVIIVAKDNQVHQRLSGQFERREVRKEYLAIVQGVPELASDHIRTFMCVHPRVREKMMVCPEGGNAREAVSFYRTALSFGTRYALVELHPSTGRTHQLRVHMQYIGNPIVADRLYGGQSFLKAIDLVSGKPPVGHGSGVRNSSESVSTEMGDQRELISRQALHAFRLTVRHPLTGEEMQFEAPLPEDFRRTIDHLTTTFLHQ